MGIQIVAKGGQRMDGATKWGNPNRVTKDLDREESVDRYRYHLAQRITDGDITVDDLLELDGVACTSRSHPEPDHLSIIDKAVDYAKEHGGKALMAGCERILAANPYTA